MLKKFECNRERYANSLAAKPFTECYAAEDSDYLYVVNSDGEMELIHGSNFAYRATTEEWKTLCENILAIIADSKDSLVLSGNK